MCVQGLNGAGFLIESLGVFHLLVKIHCSMKMGLTVCFFKCGCFQGRSRGGEGGTPWGHKLMGLEIPLGVPPGLFPEPLRKTIDLADNTNLQPCTPLRHPTWMPFIIFIIYFIWIQISAGHCVKMLKLNVCVALLLFSVISQVRLGVFEYSQCSLSWRFLIN